MTSFVCSSLWLPVIVMTGSWLEMDRRQREGDLDSLRMTSFAKAAISFITSSLDGDSQNDILYKV
jgi:hypothetical protein